MQFKKILVFFGFIIIILGGIYFLMSPYQNCLRTVDEKIEEVRNKLATETDINQRETIKLEQEKLVHQRGFGCFERTNW